MEAITQLLLVPKANQCWVCQPPSVSAASVLSAAACDAITVARLVGSVRGSPLVSEAFCIYRTLGLRLPERLHPHLLARGGEMLEGSARQLAGSGCMEVMAAERVTPPEAWSEVAFKARYRDMVVNSEHTSPDFLTPPPSTMLMHALGHRVVSTSWWDRTLQQLVYNEAAPGQAMGGTARRELPHLVLDLRTPRQ
ncbi:hypothetical protein FOA52_009996 [Chlamydomonas sp. UWO 241]|nr:hypothetical protein FOA52_009996 [Chlamydomonas sp. UWO 241]